MVILKAAGAMTIGNCFEAVSPEASVAWTVRVKFPAVVGVPAS